MTAARDAEGQPVPPRLPAKPAAHPSVQAVLARRGTGGIARPSAVIDTEWLRELCLAAGADDTAAVSVDHPDLSGEREHVQSALPGTRTLIAMAVRMNRDNCRSPARSVANQEFHQTDEQANHTARSVTRALQDSGYRALNPSVGYRSRVTDSESASMWQSLSSPPGYKCGYRLAVRPAGEDVLGPYLDDRKNFMDCVLRPFQVKKETLYVLLGSHAQEYARRRFPHKPAKEVTGGWQPPAKRSASPDRETRTS
ncbi:hypothetical protein [Streptomyces sp. NBC_00459]|uniref:hypothetical protein n=1 Tax=Streptomyces sp. NBC_00459 TaxID=2975749 RepID=UPI002E173AA2